MNNFQYPRFVGATFHSEPDDDEIDWSELLGDDDASGDSDLYDIFGPKK